MNAQELAARTIRRILAQRPGAALDSPGCLAVLLTEKGYISQWLTQDQLIASLRNDDEVIRNGFVALLASVRTATPEELICSVAFRVPTLPDLDGQTIILAAQRPKAKQPKRFKGFRRRPKAA
jgi:hypothetical protein